MLKLKDKNKNQLLILLLVVGFLSGIIYENIIAKNQIVITEIFSTSNLQRYLQTDLIAEKYMIYVIKSRIVSIVIICTLSCVKWKKIFVSSCLICTGFLTGCLCVSSVLNLGAKGLLLCFTGLFPQALCYGFVYGMLYIHWFYYPERKWNRTKTLFTILLFILGVILEVYVNPILVRYVIGIL